VDTSALIDRQFLQYNASDDKWVPEDVSMKEKRVERFTGNGTWTVPTGVTYAIAHMIGGGGGCGTTTTAGNGGLSSVDFASGLVSANGGTKGISTPSIGSRQAGAANTGQPATWAQGDTIGVSGATASSWVVAGADVTPAASISVVVGAGGTSGTSGAAGGSGYVYIEYEIDPENEI